MFDKLCHLCFLYFHSVFFSMASSGNISDDFANITLEEEDEGGLMCEELHTWEIATFDDMWCLVGRFLTEGAIDFSAMQQTLAAL